MTNSIKKMISVIIPTYNEKKNISEIIGKLLKEKKISEIIFIDDKSTDGTFVELKKFLFIKKLKAYTRNSKNRDLSKSVLYGVNKSKNSLTLVMDCDLQHNPKYINEMYKIINKQKSDIVIASRFGKNSFKGNLGFFRSFISNVAIQIINIFLGRRSNDPLSGFFLCKKELITKYEKYFFKRGYKILFDIIYNGKQNIKINHLKIYFNKRKYENSKFNFKVVILFIAQIVHTFIGCKKK
jgi:dolichol-phosphate mannosyltransferase